MGQLANEVHVHSEQRNSVGPKHFFALFICLSFSLYCVKFPHICEILVGFFVSVRVHYSREVLQNLFSSWGKVKRRVFEPVCWEQRAGRGREITACKISRISISSFATSPFLFIMLFHVHTIFYYRYFHWTSFPCIFFLKVKKTMYQILSEGNSVWSHWMLYTS